MRRFAIALACVAWGCGTSEIWVSGRGSPLAADVSSVVVGMHAANTFVLDVFEFSGVTGPYQSTNGNGTDGALASAPSLPARPGELVFSTLTACGSPALAASSPFVALDTNDDGASAAYYVPAIAGSYGAAWNDPGGPWGVATVVFE